MLRYVLPYKEMQFDADSSNFVARSFASYCTPGSSRYMRNMHEIRIAKASRRPRFRRSSQPPAFRVTDADVAIVRQIARHRFLRSTHIAALVGRSLDRTNDRLSRLFHAGYIDRPRAQLDYYPSAGSAPMVYALADLGAHLLLERDRTHCANAEWSRKNRDGGRPFIDHQLEIMDFYVALELAVRGRSDIRLIHSDELVAAFPEKTRRMRNPLTMQISVFREGKADKVSLIPDLIFGIGYRDGSKRCFMVEIDRGTMPISRSDLTQTSFKRKMRAYLAAHASGQHEHQFRWKTFRVLTVTTDRNRWQSMLEALSQLDAPQSPGPALFLFALRDELRRGNPLAYTWRDGAGREMKLI
jgi:hypothetical protein